MRTYICTCGISILTKSGINIERFRNVPLSRWNELEDDIVAVRDRVSESLKRLRVPAQLDDTCAEIKSLVKMGVKPDDRVILIASDTVDCKLCAQLVETFLAEQEICAEVDIRVIKGLQAVDGGLFLREGWTRNDRRGVKGHHPTKPCLASALLKMIWVDSFYSGDKVEVAVGGDDFLDVVVDHGGGMEGVPRFNLGVGF